MPLATDGTVHVVFNLVNLTKVDALGVEVVIQICDECKYAKEPDGLTKLPGQKETERYVLLNDLHAIQAYKDISLDILPPSTAGRFQIAFSYRCSTCILQMEPSQAYVHIAGR